MRWVVSRAGVAVVVEAMRAKAVWVAVAIVVGRMAVVQAAALVVAVAKVAALWLEVRRVAVCAGVGMVAMARAVGRRVADLMLDVRVAP